MRAIGVSKYGPIDNFESREIPRPAAPTGRDLLVQVKACSVNPIDCKVRGGVYDDAPDYYENVPKDFHIIGFDGSGTVVEVGPDCEYYKPGDDVSYVGATTRQGSNSEYQLVSEMSCARKPKSLDFVEAASFGLTFGTAYQSLHDRLEIKPGENVGILIINGGGGVGSAAIQMAHNVFNLPAVVATASREETVDSCKRMGATHVIDHKKNLVEQVKALNLEVPIKYVYILGPTGQYLSAVGTICAPFGKVCSIVQADVRFYGTEFMSKSLTFSWDWLGSAGYHRTNLGSYRTMMSALAGLMEEGKLVPTLGKRYKLTLEGLKEAHRQIESKTTVGKIALGVDEPGEGVPFA